MHNRKRFQDLARETLDIIECGSYRVGDRVIEIRDWIENAVHNSVLYEPVAFEHLEFDPKRHDDIVLEVTNETTLQAVRRLKEDGFERVVALNFASAKHPGGGFLNGSMAQEESLMYASALYPAISQMKKMYEFNIKMGSALYSDHMIYSPDVPVFRDKNYRLTDEVVLCSFVSAPAVNAGVIREKECHNIKKISPTMRRRIERILRVAAHHGHEAIVLGAFGCGVFKNNPNEVARYFRELLVGEGKYAKQFRRVVFAVYDPSPGQGILTAFRQMNAFWRAMV